LPRRRCPAPTNNGVTSLWRCCDARHRSYWLCMPIHSSGPVPRASDSFSAMSAEIPRGYNSRCATGDPGHPKVLGGVCERRTNSIISRFFSALTRSYLRRRSVLALAFFEQHVGHAQIRHQLLQRSFSCRSAFASSLVGARLRPVTKDGLSGIEP
jgi:hypothetical protein